MKYCVIILVHNMLYFETMLKNMPKQNEDICFVICNDERVIDLRKEIIDQISKNKNKANFKFLYISKTIDFIKDNLDLDNIGNEFVDMYNMGGNINTIYYLKDKFEKYLILDDDVLIFKDLIDIFECEESNQNMFCRNFLSSGRGRENDEDMKVWLDFSKVDFDTYLSNNINGGQKLYTNKSLKIYGKMLEEFYNNEHFLNNWKRWKIDGKNKAKAFFMDQYFDNAFAWRIDQNKKQNNTLQNYCLVLYSMKHLLKHKERYLNNYIIHYCCGKNKFEFVKVLQEEGLIN